MGDILRPVARTALRVFVFGCYTNLDYFVGAKHLGDNLTGKLDICISQMLRPGRIRQP
jgi:hypothetical protein